MVAPSPIPALPDAERRTQYVIAASIGPLNVGFQIYGDGTNYTDWIQVYVNSVLLDGSAYSLTSPSGALGAMARPITDARITFTAAQTGTVQIVGARRPRRVTQFTENQGVSARDLNQAITDMVAIQREAWDLRNRTIHGLPGDVFAPLSAAARASTLLGFDAAGALAYLPLGPTISVTAGSRFNTRGLAAAATIDGSVAFIDTAGYATTGDLGGGTYVRAGGSTTGGFQSADGAWWALVALSPCVEQFGAKGDAITDDTTAIQAAINYLGAPGGTVRLAARQYRVGAGDVAINMVSSCQIVGQGPNNSKLVTSSVSGTVITMPNAWSGLRDLWRKERGGRGGGYVAVTGGGNAYCLIFNVTMDAVAIGITSNAALLFVDQTRIHNIIAATGIGIQINGGGGLYINQSNIVAVNFVSQPYAGINLTECGNAIIVACNIVAGGQDLLINPVAGKLVGAVFAVGTFFDSSDVGLKCIPNGAGAVVGTIDFTQCTFNSSPSNVGVSIAPTGGAVVRDVSFTSCKCFGNPLGGITLTGAVADVNVTGCTIAGNGGTGLLIDTGVNNVTVTGNRIGNAVHGALGNVNGIVIAAATDGLIIRNNNLRGNVTANLTNNSTGTHNSIGDNLIVT